MKNSFNVLTNVFNQQEIFDLNNHMYEHINTTQYDRPAVGIVKNAEVLIVDWADCKNFLNKTFELASWVNQMNFGFSIWNFTDMNSVNFNIYNAGDNGQYEWHTDASPPEEAYDIKYTVCINVSTEEFEGGDFEVFRHGIINVKEFKQPGSMIVFPGFLNHRVSPVTKGTRKTISYWVHGPKFS